MSIIGSNILAGASGQAGGGGAYEISRSVRFNSADSAYLSRTPASAGNRRTWTWAGWVKLSSVTTAPSLFMCRNGGGDSGISDFIFNSDGTVVFTGAANTFFTTTQVLRDFSAWYHLVLSVDTTAATAGNRIRFYLNGSQVTTFNNSYNPTQNFELAINQAAEHDIGGKPAVGEFFNGYLADIHFIDGQALDPSSFGEFDTNGVWQPIDASGLTFGTNGFHLPFADNSTAAALGTDNSSNGNTWTVNNISVTAGAGNDSLVDSPTNGSQTDTGVGGEVVGNYCTWNPIGTAGPASSNGNLDIASSSAAGNKIGTILLTSGKWYWECVGDGYAGAVVGVGGEGFTSTLSSAGSKAIGYWSGGGIYWDGGSSTSGIASYTTSDVIGIAVDMTAGTVAFYKNNSLVYTATFGSGTVPNLSSGVYPGFNTGNPSGIARTVVANFGQRQWAYAAPAGFKALCTTNLPEPTIADGSTVMDVALYTGNGSTQTISGLNFDPDLVWIKGRSGATDHALYDTVRTATKQLESNTATAETTEATGLTAFATGGFSLGALAQVNTSSATYAAWTWDAGSSTVTNTDGSITSQVRANASAGFSIVTWTGVANGTVGHGLGVSPELIIAKSRTQGSYDWVVYHKSLGNGQYIALNSTAAALSYTNYWGTVSATTFLGNSPTDFYNNGGDMVAYCWSPVAGYSSFGSYTGNGSADGPFVFTSLRPAFVLIKATSAVGGNWMMYDNKRAASNLNNKKLAANTSLQENEGANLGDDSYGIDFLSNGFKIKQVGANHNASGTTYIYAAFAENPFQYARAR